MGGGGRRSAGTRRQVEDSAGAFFAAGGSGKVTIRVNQAYVPKDADRDLGARRTMGSTVLTV
jgi:hypothetical protein